MKSIYFFEAAGVAKYRENIVKERLVYIKYLMDNTSNKKDATQLERMYNALYNCNYDVNGKLRSLQSMFTYINQTMTENKGVIPGLPTEEQIENLDEKASAFKNLHKQDFEAYLTRFEKSNLDKAGTKKDDEAKGVLSPENPDDNEKALKSIREISSIFGLTNILGLEPKRKPSDNDLKHQAELKKQQADGNPNASPEDDQDKKDANKDAAAVTGGEEPQEPQQAGGEDETPEPPEPSSGEGEGSEADAQNELLAYTQAIIDDYMDNTEQEEYNEEDVDNYLGDLSESGLEEDELKNMIKLIKDGIKKNFEDGEEGEDEEEDDGVDYDALDDEMDGGETSENLEALVANVLESKDGRYYANMINEAGKAAVAAGGAAIAAGAGLKYAMTPKGGAAIVKASAKIGAKIGGSIAKTSAQQAGAGALKAGVAGVKGAAAGGVKGGSFAVKALSTLHQAANGGGIAAQAISVMSSPAFIAGGAAVAALGITAMVVRKVKKNRTKKMAAGMKAQIEKEKDPKKKAELQKNYDNMMKACFDKKGRPLARPKLKKLPKEDRDAFKQMYKEQKHNKELKNAGKELIKKGQFSKDTVKGEKERIKNGGGSEESTQDNGETVKDKDGSEIVARKKKNGSGSTYVRKKNGKETGYATKDEFMAAKKAAKESFGMKNLSDYLMERLS